MDDTNQIIQTIINKSGLKAKEIAAATGLNRKQVNAVLYGVLKNKVFRTDDFRWYPKKQEVNPPLEIDEEVTPKQIDGTTSCELESIDADELRFQDPFRLENHGDNNSKDSELATIEADEFTIQDSFSTPDNNEGNFLDSYEDKTTNTNKLLAYPAATEELDLWRRYFRRRRIDEIIKSETNKQQILVPYLVLMRISEDIGKSSDLIKLLKILSGLSEIDDKIIDNSSNSTNSMIELYRLVQNSKNGSPKEYKRDTCCLQDFFGFVFGEMLNNIAFGKGNTNLVEKVVKTTGNELFDVKTQIYKLAIDRDLFPSVIVKLFDTNAPLKNLPKLVESIQLNQSAINKSESFIKEIRADGKAAFDRIIESHMRLGIKSAQYFTSRNSNLDFDDLSQAGNIGLIIAAEHFNPVFGHRFMSYAPNWVYRSIEREIADHSRDIRIPVHLIESVNALERVRWSLTQQLGREPTSNELGEKMGISSAKVKELDKLVAIPISLDSSINDMGDSTLINTIEDYNAFPPVEAASEQLLKEQIDEVLSSLTYREQRVLILRFGLEDGRSRTLEEIGQEFHLTRERIRQIEAKALRKLRHPSRSSKLKDYLE